MNDMNCNIVGDLLPLYAEKMVSPDTEQAVADHLENCENCRAKYKQMIAVIPVPAAENKEAVKPLKKFRFHMLLNILGIPLWLPLLITAFAIALVLYICMWVVVICLWCIPLSFGAVSLSGIVAAISSFVPVLSGNLLISIGCIFAGAGLAVLTFYPCLWLSKCLIRFTVFIWKQTVMKFFTRNKGGRQDV